MWVKSLNVFFNKIYTYEHLTPALWFRGVCICICGLLVLQSLQSVLNSVHGNRKPSFGYWNFQRAPTSPVFQPQTREKGENRGSVRAIKEEPRLFHIWLFSRTLTQLYNYYMYALQSNHVALCSVQSPLVVGLWWDGKTFLISSLKMLVFRNSF